MRVIVHWTNLEDKHPLWQLSRGLYSYWSPTASRLFYLGKVDGTTVRGRWNAPDKRGLWSFIERRLGYRDHAVFAGEILLAPGGRLTLELLADIESLMISRLEPVGNIQSVRSRIERPGLIVECRGDWPSRRRRFVDN